MEAAAREQREADAAAERARKIERRAAKATAHAVAVAAKKKAAEDARALKVAAKLETNMAAAAKPTVTTVNTKIDKVLDALGSLGLDVGDIGRVVSPSATQPVVVAAPAKDDSSQLILFAGLGLLALMMFKKGGL